MTSDPIEQVGRGLRLVSSLYGVLMIIIGIAALALPVVSTFATVLVIGIVMIAGGIVGLIATFTERKSGGVWLNALGPSWRSASASGLSRNRALGPCP